MLPEAHERRLAMGAAKRAWVDLEAAGEQDLPGAIGRMRLAMDRLAEANIALRYATAPGEDPTILELGPVTATWTMVGRWLGDHLWLCHICMTRCEANATACPCCGRGIRPPAPGETQEPSS